MALQLTHTLLCGTPEQASQIVGAFKARKHMTFKQNVAVAETLAQAGRELHISNT